jgi:hypothetical protein
MPTMYVGCTVASAWIEFGVQLLGQRTLQRKEVKTMKYEKPEVVALASAMRVIQNGRCSKGIVAADSSACLQNGPKTANAYQAYE